MQKQSEPSGNDHQLQRELQGSPAGVVEPYLWQILYSRHVLREIEAGRAQVGEDGMVLGIAPSKVSEIAYWLELGSPPLAGDGVHYSTLCAEHLHENTLRNERSEKRAIMRFFDQHLPARYIPRLRGLLESEMPEQAQPIVAITPTAPEGAMSAEADSPREDEAQDPPAAAAATAAKRDAYQQDEAVELGTTTALLPLPLAASSNVTVAGRPQRSNVTSQDEDTSHHELYEATRLVTTAVPPPPTRAVCSNVSIGSRLQRLTMPNVTTRDEDTSLHGLCEESRLAATAALSPLPPPLPATSLPPAVGGRPCRLRMPMTTSPSEALPLLEDAPTGSPIVIAPRDSSFATDSPSQELLQLDGRCENDGACFPSVEVRPWACAPQIAGIGCSADCTREGAAGLVLCEKNSKTAAVRRQRSPTDSATRSTSPQQNGKVVTRRATKKKRMKVTASTPVKNSSPAHAGSARASRPSCCTDSCWKLRYSHTTVCASCEKPPLETEHVGLCSCCPRIFCPGCLGKVSFAGTSAAVVGAVALGGQEHDSSGESTGASPPGGCFVGLDVSILKCPFCLRGADLELPPPPSPPHTEDVSPKAHLIHELLKHDLSHCFRVPVDVEANAGYLDAVNRDYMMDLGTMMTKIGAGKYYGDRGSAAFYLDLGRVWDNSRAYAGCDKQGRPLVRSDEANVPGILRCAFLLETMARKFVKTHLPTDELSPQWYVQLWDPFPNPSSNPNPKPNPHPNQDPQQNPISNPNLEPISNPNSDLNPNQGLDLDRNPISSKSLNPKLNLASDSNPSPTSKSKLNPSRNHDSKS